MPSLELKNCSYFEIIAINPEKQLRLNRTGAIRVLKVLKML